MPDSNINVTLHFGVEQDVQGFQNVIRSLDKVQEAAIKNMQLKGFDKVTIDQYKSNIESLKHAIESSWDDQTKTFDLAYAMKLPEAQKALGSMQQIMDGVKISVDETGESFESSGLKIDKYSDKIDHFKLTLANAFRYNVVNRAIDMITNSIRGMIDYVIELDSALNSIRIITGKSSEEMLQFAAANQDTAKQLGRTATEYAQAALIFYQQGLDDSQVEARTNAALKLANITGQTVQETTNQMTAIWNNFADGSHNLEYYEDVITALGATTASSSKEIAGGLEKFAAIGNTVGLSYEYAASALATVVATTRQSEDVVGTAFKTMFARLQSLKLGETLDDGTTLTKYTQALESIGISVLDQNGNLKDMDAILDEIGAKWQTLDRNQQTALANTVGGVRQYAQFIALFDNFEFFKENVTTALESAGTVTKQNEIYMETYGAKIKQIKATLDSIKFDILGNKDFTALLDTLDKFLVTFRVILKDFGGLNQLLTIGGGLMLQMFLPQIIMKFTTSLLQLNSNLDNTEKKGISLKSIFSNMFASFSLTKDFSNIQNALNQIKDKSLSVSQTNILLEKSYKQFGESGKVYLQGLIKDIDNLQKKLQETTYNDFTKLLNNDDINGIQQRIYSSIKNNVPDLNGELYQRIANIINPNTVTDITSLTEAFGNLRREFQGYNINWEQIFPSNLLHRISETEQKIDQFGQTWKRAIVIQQSIKYFTAASTAIRGLSDAFDKLQEGDKLGAVSQSLSSIGSALMMTGEPTTMGIGAALTTAGTIVSVVKAKMEKELKEAREERDKFLEDYKNLNATSINIDNLLSTYDKLIHKIKLTSEEQEQLNNVIEQLRNILGDNNFDGVAYYTSEGDAVYYDTEKLRENTEELIRNREERLKNAEASSNKAAKSQSKDFNKDVSKLQFNNQILEYMNQVNEAQLSEEETMKMWASIMAENNIVPEDLPVMLEGKNFDQYWKELEEELRSEAKNVSDNLEKDYEDIFSNMEIKIELPTLEFNSKSLEDMSSNFYQYLKDNIGKIDGLEWSPDMFDSYNTFVAENGEILSKAMEDANAYTQVMQKLKQSTDPVLQALHHMLQQWHEDIEQNVKDQDTQIQSIYATKESLQAAVEDIEGYSESLTSLQEIYNEFNETQKLTNEQISELLELVGDNDAVRDLIELYQDGSLSLDEFNDAFSSIIDEWILSLPFLEGLTDETKNYASEMLALLGYTQDEINNILSRAELNNSINNVKHKISGIKDSFFDVINSTPRLSQALIIAGLDLNAMANEAWWTEENINDLIRVTGSPTFALQTGPFEGSINIIIGLVNQALEWINKLAKFQIKLKKTDEIKTPGGGEVTTPKGRGGGGGGGGGAAEEEYEATIDKYEKYKNQLKDIEDEINLIEERIKNEEDPLIKNELLEEKNKKLKEHNDLLHETNEIYRADAAEAYNWLLENGFDIYYDPDKQEYTIYNWERINEVTKESTKATNEWRKEAEAQKKILEDNNKACEENSKKWRDNTQAIEDNRKQMLKNEMDSFNDKISDKLFYTAFYEGLDSGLPKLKQIYSEVLQDSYDQLNSLYARGLTDADDEVQKLWKDILKYEKELRDIDDEIYENRIKNIERTEKMLPDTPDKYQKQVELAEQKILLARQRAAELWAEGTEEAMEKIHDIYQDEWDALEDKYKALRALLDQEQDYLDDVSKAAQYVLDKQIDALKEQQEQLKDSNEQREKEIELMRLKANLDAANNQKTVRVYRRGQGFVWEANKKAIQDAEKALNDFNKQNEEDELQKEIDALTKYKKQWSDVPKTIEEEENLKKIILQEGANFVQDILNQSIDRLDDYTDRYKANAEARIQVDKDELEAKKQVAEEAKKLESEQYNINQNTSSSQNDRNVWYADTEGKAPKEAKIGDAIQTKGGLYVIVKEGTPGANKNEETGKWSILLDTFRKEFVTWTKDLAGTSLKDDDLKKQIFSQVDELLGPFEEEILPDITNGINDNTINVFDLNTNITDLNKGLYIYSSDIRDAIIHGQDLVSAAAVHSRTAKSSADDAWSAANFAWARANDASNSANRAEMSSGPTSGTQNHKGIEMGPIGSDKGKQAFDSNLTRIARGDIKDDEMWALLQKGEAVFTPEQLNNITGALNYSLNSINKLSTLNNKMFSLGQLSAINSMPNDNNMKQQTVTFGNINITMNGVNDVDSFGMILRNNIKGIFAQTIAKE